MCVCRISIYIYIYKPHRHYHRYRRHHHHHQLSCCCSCCCFSCCCGPTGRNIRATTTADNVKKQRANTHTHASNFFPCHQFYFLLTFNFLCAPVCHYYYCYYCVVVEKRNYDGFNIIRIRNSIFRLKWTKKNEKKPKSICKIERENLKFSALTHTPIYKWLIHTWMLYLVHSALAFSSSILILCVWHARK